MLSQCSHHPIISQPYTAACLIECHKKAGTKGSSLPTLHKTGFLSFCRSFFPLFGLFRAFSFPGVPFFCFSLLRLCDIFGAFSCFLPPFSLFSLPLFSILR